MKKAIFLDKDGTIIQNVPYNIDFKKITILPETVEGLRLLQQRGYYLIIATNQSGIEKGYFSEYQCVAHIHAVIDIFRQQGIFIAGYYYCPHDNLQTPQGIEITCTCRKPKPGMLIQGAKDFSLSLPMSWMIGDILNDIEAGNAASTRTILVNNGNETEWNVNKKRQPLHIVHNIYQAATYIIKHYE